MPFRFACPSCGYTVQLKLGNVLKSIGFATVAGVLIWAALLGALILVVERGWNIHDNVSRISWIVVFPFVPLVFFLRRFPPLSEVEPGEHAPGRFHVYFAYGALMSTSMLLTFGIPILAMAAYAKDWERILEMVAMLSVMVCIGFVPALTWKLHCYGDQRNKLQDCSQQEAG